MRLTSSIFVLIAWGLLLTPSTADAATLTPVAGSIQAALRTAPGHPAPQPGPLATQVVARSHPAAAMRADDADPDGDDDAMIQDDTPAAGIDAGERLAPALEPLGTLSSSCHSLPSHRILSRRSPRGPPAS